MRFWVFLMDGARASIQAGSRIFSRNFLILNRLERHTKYLCGFFAYTNIVGCLCNCLLLSANFLALCVLWFMLAVGAVRSPSFFAYDVYRVAEYFLDDRDKSGYIWDRRPCNFILFFYIQMSLLILELGIHVIPIYVSIL